VNDAPDLEFHPDGERARPADTAPASGRRVDRRRAAARRGLHRRIYRVRVASTGGPRHERERIAIRRQRTVAAAWRQGRRDHAPAARRDRHARAHARPGLTESPAVMAWLPTNGLIRNFTVVRLQHRRRADTGQAI